MDNVGKMRERIQISTLTLVRDGLLGSTKQWVEEDQIFAQVTHKATGTDEVFAADQKTNDSKVDFRIRYRQVSSTSEIVYRNKRYRIEGVIPDEKKDYLTIETKQIQENYAG